MIDMLKTYLLKINNDLDLDVFLRLQKFISEEKKRRIMAFHNYKDAQRSLLGDIMVRLAICNSFNIYNKDIVFVYNQYGKPHLYKLSGIHFNISHSGNWVVCAVDSSPVGIDVEIINQIDFSIAKRFFAKEEYMSIVCQPKEMQLRHFYKIWTLKESYIKAEGKGMSISLNSFAIIFDGDRIKVRTDNASDKYSFYQLFLDSQSLCGICAADTHNMILKHIELNQLICESFRLLGMERDSNLSP